MTQPKEHLRKRAHTLRLGLDQRLSELYSTYYPNSEPEKLINFLHDLVEKIDERIESSDSRRLFWICYVLENLEGFLADLHYANSEEIPRGLILILQDIVAELFPSVVLMASPQHEEFNYSIEDIFPTLSEYANGLLSTEESKVVLNSFNDRFDVIRFPRIERDNVLNYPIFGHELGHPVADEFLDKEESTEVYQKRLEKAVKDVPTELGVDEGEDLLVEIKEMLAIRKRGLQELISDCVGIFLFGPSALFAFYDFFLAQSLDEEPGDPEYYPPNRYRLRIMKKAMDDQRYTEALTSISNLDKFPTLREKLESFLCHLDEIAAEDIDQQLLSSDPLHKISYEWIEESLPSAIKYALNRVNSLKLPCNLIEKEIPELIEKLSFGVPPNEVGIFPDRKHVDWRSSILSGWLYRIGEFSVPYSEKRELERNSIERLQRLTLRAVELAIFESSYKSQKSATDGEGT